MNLLYLFTAFIMFYNKDIIEYYVTDMKKSGETMVVFSTMKNKLKTYNDVFGNSKECKLFDRYKNEIIFIKSSLKEFDEEITTANEVKYSEKIGTFIYNILELGKINEKEFKTNMTKLDEKLMNAVYSRCYDKVVEYVEQGANVNAINKFGESIIMNLQNHSVVFVDYNSDKMKIKFNNSDNKKILKFLLEKGADLNIKDQYGKTFAERNFFKQDYSEILGEHADKIDCILYNMLNQNKFDKFKYFIEKKANLYNCDLIIEAIFKTCQRDDDKYFNELMKQNFDVNKKNNSQISLLTVFYINCKKTKQLKYLKMLVEKGLDLNIIESFLDYKSITALDYIIETGNELYEYYKECVKEKDKVDCEFYLNALKYEQELIEYLKSKGAKRSCEILNKKCENRISSQFAITKGIIKIYENF